MGVPSLTAWVAQINESRTFDELTQEGAMSSEEIHSLQINRVCVGSERVYSVGEDGNLIAWRKSDLTCIKTIQVSETQLVSLVIGEQYIFAGGVYLDTKIWQWRRDDLSMVTTLEDDSSSKLALALSDDGLLASGTADGRVSLRSVQTVDQIASVQTDQQIILSVAIDSHFVYAGGIGNYAGVFTRSPFEQVTRLEGHNANVFSLTTDDKFLYSGSGEVWWGGPGSPRPSSFESAIRVWDKTNWECVAILEGHTNNVNSIVVDESSVYSVSDDGTLRVYNKEDWRLAAIVDSGSGNLYGLAADDDYVFTGGRGCRVWKIPKDALKS